MSEECARIIQSLASLLIAAVAIIAIWISVRTEDRNQKRFQEQISESKRIAEYNVKPFLWVYQINYLDHKAIKLVNSGMGTAIITSYELKRGDNTDNSLHSLFNFHMPFYWDTYWRFGEHRFYLPAGQEKVLVEITSRKLARQKLNQDDIRKIMSTWDEQLLEITIKFEYTDIFDKPQSVCLYPNIA